MPEGPSIVILKHEVSEFIGKTVVAVDGNTKTDKERLVGQTITDFKSWGKHFLICFPEFIVRIHFLLFGTYRVNERKESAPRLRLEFDKGEIGFYACSVQFLEGIAEAHYDFSADVMNDDWNPKAAIKKLSIKPSQLICDALLEQDIFAGVGNIIKNEVLYRVKVHPESAVGTIPKRKISEIVDEARIYSFQFLEWKKNYELKKHWFAHAKKMCVRCELPLIKKITGQKRRRSFYCENCQKKYPKR